MKEIEEILSEINDKRDCGNVIFGIEPCENESSVGEIAALFGLKNAEDIYQEIPSEEAASILTQWLHRDMAYNVELLSLETAQALTARLMKRINLEKARFYTNRRFGVFGWDPATDATFDSGLLILENQSVICIWFEDED